MGRQRRDERAYAAAVADNLHLPPTLHPVIDADICIGTLACVKVCPEGDIIGIVDGVAKLIEGANCIGHGRCAAECPVDAIKLVIGTAERGIDLPEINTYFETARPGVHVIGELGGMGLIKNAIEQGVQVVQQLRPLISKGSRSMPDLGIVGAGPAGLAAAVTCRQLGLSFVLIDQDTVGGAVNHYARQKLVMVDSVELPFYGTFGGFSKKISKEELLEIWQKTVRKARIEVAEGITINDIHGQDGNFQMVTTAGTIPVKKVLLAVGRRGTPRKLGCPGEELDKVTYRLIDPEQYNNCKVLVVGGGDSALEAASMLAESSSAEVSICYRQPGFNRARRSNRDKVMGLIQRERIRAFFNTEVKDVKPTQVVLQVNGKTKKIENDFTIACLGGELPTEFLKRVGVKIKRHHGTETIAAAVQRPGRRPVRPNAPGSPRAAKKPAPGISGSTVFLSLLGIAVITALTLNGWDYYRLPSLARHLSEDHQRLRPSGLWGHGIGVFAAVLMMLNFAYVFRKRWLIFHRTGTIQGWLDFHVFAGLVGASMAAYHAAFQSNNLIATELSVTLAIVVLTGLFGHYFYGLVTTPEGKSIELSALHDRWRQFKQAMDPSLEGVNDATPIRRLLDWVTAETSRSRIPFIFLYHIPVDYFKMRRWLARIRRHFPTRDKFRHFSKRALRLVLLRNQIGFYSSIKSLMSIWRIVHIVLSVILAVLVTIHVVANYFLGYRWILH